MSKGQMREAGISARVVVRFHACNKIGHDGIARSQPGELPGTRGVERTGRDDHGACAILRERCKRRVDLIWRAGFQDEETLSERAGVVACRLLVKIPSGLFGSIRSATTLACGTNSLSISRCLPPRSPENQLGP